MYVRYLAYAPLSLFFNLFVILTCPIWAAWAAYTPRLHLPGIARWVYSHDDDIYGSAMTGDPVPGTWWRRMKRAMWWLCRNPGYGFDAHVLGFAHEGSTVIKVAEGRYVMSDAKRNMYFGWRRDVPLFGDRYIKLWFGWHNVPKAGRHMLKFDINPFKRKAV